MDFINELRQLASRAQALIPQLKTEEATKQALILPFLQLLGYNVFDPGEVVPEFTADVGSKKGEKVDYAILIDGQPAILIEAKCCDDPLTSHDAQLFRYFTTTSAKFAVLTNGVMYKFYSDLQDPNKMDEDPFLEFNLFDFMDSTIQAIKKFHKEKFNAEVLSTDAEVWMYTTKIKTRMDTQFKNPNEEFVRYWAKEVYSSKITQGVLDKFKDIVKAALGQYMAESINERIQTAIQTTTSTQQDPPTETVTPVPEPDDGSGSSKVHTTDTELEAYYLIKAIIHDILEPSRVSYRDYTTFFGIIVDGSPRKRICRMGLEGNKKWVSFTLEDKTEKNCPIENVNDLFNLKEDILESAKRLA